MRRSHMFYRSKPTLPDGFIGCIGILMFLSEIARKERQKERSKCRKRRTGEDKTTI